MKYDYEKRLAFWQGCAASAYENAQYFRDRYLAATCERMRKQLLRLYLEEMKWGNTYFSYYAPEE